MDSIPKTPSPQPTEELSFWKRFLQNAGLAPSVPLDMGVKWRGDQLNFNNRVLKSLNEQLKINQQLFEDNEHLAKVCAGLERRVGDLENRVK